MAEPKTKPTKASVDAFLKKTAGDRLADCKALVKIMRRVSGAKPVMMGTAIVGFGSTTITYANGKTADWPLIAFSPRKAAMVLYLPGLKRQAALLKKLGKFTTGGGCLYVKKFADIDVAALETLIATCAKLKKAAS